MAIIIPVPREYVREAVVLILSSGLLGDPFIYIYIYMYIVKF